MKEKRMSNIKRTRPKMVPYICIDCKKIIDGTNVICPHCYSMSVVRATPELKRYFRVSE